jgi:REP element-mobilizing transposase RayT
MSEPLAYHITWTTYGSWLPGDARGWVKRPAQGIQSPEGPLERNSHSSLAQLPVVLDDENRQVVEQTIQRHCEIRSWTLRALNVRTNHVHLIVSAPVSPEKAMGEFKSWCSRKLNERAGNKREWWTRHGSTKWINDEEYLENAIRYVIEGQ